MDARAGCSKSARGTLFVYGSLFSLAVAQNENAVDLSGPGPVGAVLCFGHRLGTGVPPGAHPHTPAPPCPAIATPRCRGTGRRASAIAETSDCSSQLGPGRPVLIIDHCQCTWRRSGCGERRTTRRAARSMHHLHRAPPTAFGRNGKENWQCEQLSPLLRTCSDVVLSLGVCGLDACTRVHHA